jgi:hypothetical protein
MMALGEQVAGAVSVCRRVLGLAEVLDALSHSSKDDLGFLRHIVLLVARHCSNSHALCGMFRRSQERFLWRRTYQSNSSTSLSKAANFVSITDA